MLQEWLKEFEISKDINDDNLPVVYGELGSYIIGGFFGAKVKWGAGGAYPEKLINDITRFEKYLNFSEENEYYRLQIGLTEFLAKHCDDKFGYTEMLAIDGLNLLDCLRGIDAYTDVIDYPDYVFKLLDFGSDFNINFIKKQRDIIKPYEGGRFNFYQIWTPAEIIFISLDAYGSCSKEIFKKFGRKYVQRLIDEFGGGWLHVHSDAIRLLPDYLKLNNIIAIGLEDSIKHPRIIEIIDEVKHSVGEIPLMININKDEIIQKIKSKTLYGNILYWVNGIDNIKEANIISEMCMRYRAPYKSRYWSA